LVFLAVLDLFIVNIAFPAFRRSFPSASLASLSWILSGYAIVFAAVLVPAGKLADTVGRKRVLRWALVEAATHACTLSVPRTPFGSIA
jgi:MFS family permease